MTNNYVSQKKLATDYKTSRDECLDNLGLCEGRLDDCKDDLDECEDTC